VREPFRVIARDARGDPLDSKQPPRQYDRPVSDSDQIRLTRADGALRVSLAGDWRLRRGLPSAAIVEQALGSVRRVVFDTTDLGAWDTSLATFVTQVVERCARRQIAVERDGLPAGVRRLLALAEAVPEKHDARAETRPVSRPARVGAAALAAWEEALGWLAFLGSATIAFGRLVAGRARFRRVDLAIELQDAGARALPIVTLISFLVGMIMAFVGAVQLQQFGASILVANMVAITMTREMGAMMTAIIMAGRTGSAYAAQLGTMNVSQEIDALTTMGISPMEFLVLPRMLALSLMLPLLAIYADFVGIVGGAVVATGMLDVSLTQYWEQTKGALGLTTFITGVGKSVVFGTLVAVAGCLQGMRSGRSAAAVGGAATAAVVSAIVLVVVADGLFAILFNILGI
jgi:phospholipid/cholesterol/gamma-HCH transport system permease protein